MPLALRLNDMLGLPPVESAMHSIAPTCPCAHEEARFQDPISRSRVSRSSSSAMRTAQEYHVWLSSH